MSGHGRKPTRLREQSIAALITQPTVELAARQAGGSYSTLNRWIRDEQFAAEVKAARNELLQSAIDRLKSTALQAVGTLIEIANNPASSETARVTAAKALIDYALRVGAIEDLAERIEALERETANERFEDAGKTIDAATEDCWR
jgi:hypothetical protein